MNQNTATGFLKYLDEASQAVSNWPEWKKNGSDATRLQDDNKKSDNLNKVALAEKSKRS
ncbi:hypothetical protein [Pectobacterium atrosepticum]|uniref:hypothetical protein n=1 Tax=Pectobacterium atrosepticum TaxID=29471 RepID=UPI0012FE9736|nr:hypothetical protein [Pectobacterium atrosepticum]